MKITQEKVCRVCSGSLETVLDFGEIYLSGFVEYAKDAQKAPLALAKCTECGLVQLRDTVELDSMYREYWYMSSLNKSMVSSLQNVVNDAVSRVELSDGDIVVDIGCNDGTMLAMYPAFVHTVGFDPALNLTKPKCDKFINDYFSVNTYPFIPKAKIITAIAMYYDLPDPVKFTQDVATLLDEYGIFIIQFTDLQSMFKVTAFDNICHEHLEYYRLRDVISILEKVGLQAIDVSYNDVNGGSIRITAAHRGAYSPSRSVMKYLEDETKYLSEYNIEEFKCAIESVQCDLELFFKLANGFGLKGFLLGASTKGNTFLQVCGIDNSKIEFAAEVNSSKWGLYTVGSNIHIIPEDEALDLKPSYFLVPVWHFEESLTKKDNIKEYLQNGGTLVFPLPRLHLVVGNDL